MKKALLLLSLIVVISCVGQKVPPTQFGLQLRGLVPTKFIDSDNVLLEDQRLTTSVSQLPAFSFGFLVRQRLNETFSFESGIQYNRRRFAIQVQDQSVGFEDNSTLRLVNYSIPAYGLLYVQTGRNNYLNTSAGVVMDFFPSDLEKLGLDYAMSLRTGAWLKFGLAVNLGFEFRFEKKGAIYTGLSYNRALSSTAQALFRYAPQGDSLVYRTQGSIEGSFLSLDFRYFFNE